MWDVEVPFIVRGDGRFCLLWEVYLRREFKEWDKGAGLGTVSFLSRYLTDFEMPLRYPRRDVK